jgi:glycerol dehydrogenase
MPESSAMSRTFRAPGAYVQGAGVVGDPDHLAALSAETAYVLGGETALATVGEALTSALTDAGIDVAAVDGDVTACTDATIDHYRARRDAVGADVVVGVGGGVAVDVATAVAMGGYEFVSVPTVASTDAPCSTISVVYDESGNFLEGRHRERNPDLVLADTRVLAEAPVRFLRHGMGDALATRFEAEATMRSNGDPAAGEASSHVAVGVARECYRRLETHGTDALAAARRGAVTPALERVVEANVLLSGLGFESGGTAGAHAVQIALTNSGAREPHGLLVGFGTVAELVLQDRPDALDDALALLVESGLDATLDELAGFSGDVARVGELACEHGMANEPRPVTAAEAADAVRTADELVRERR